MNTDNVEPKVYETDKFNMGGIMLGQAEGQCHPLWLVVFCI